LRYLLFLLDPFPQKSFSELTRALKKLFKIKEALYNKMEAPLPEYANEKEVVFKIENSLF